MLWYGLSQGQIGILIFLLISALVVVTFSFVSYVVWKNYCSNIRPKVRQQSQAERPTAPPASAVEVRNELIATLNVNQLPQATQPMLPQRNSVFVDDVTRLPSYDEVVYQREFDHEVSRSSFDATCTF